MKLRPGSGISYTNLVISYLLVNRLDEARATAEEAQAHNLDNPLIHMNLYAIDFLQHDAAGMKREAAWLTGKLGFEDALFYTESDTAAYGGQFAEARELTRRFLFAMITESDRPRVEALIKLHSGSTAGA